MGSALNRLTKLPALPVLCQAPPSGVNPPRRAFSPLDLLYPGVAPGASPPLQAQDPPLRSQQREATQKLDPNRANAKPPSRESLRIVEAAIGYCDYLGGPWISYASLKRAPSASEHRGWVAARKTLVGPRGGRERVTRGKGEGDREGEGEGEGEG